jgi:hypothetical protein
LILTTRPADNDAPDLSGNVLAKVLFGDGVVDVQADPFEVSTLPAVPGSGNEVRPVPPLATARTPVVMEDALVPLDTCTVPFGKVRPSEPLIIIVMV